MQTKALWRKQFYQFYTLLAILVVATLGMPSQLLAAETAQPAAGAWDDRFGMPGTTELVQAIAAGANGEVYVGGRFTKVGGIDAKHIARWDGRSWQALGDGVDGDVYAIVVDGSDVYVAGNFKVAGSINAVGIARWDGAEWSNVGDGTGPVDNRFGTFETGYIYSLLVNEGVLYAGGNFAKIDGVDANNIAQWDGTTWSPVGGGMGELDWDNQFMPEGIVYALAADNGLLYAGGEFVLADEKEVNSVAQWDGTSWSALGGGVTQDDGNNTPQKGVVRALAVHNGAVYAGGWFNKAGGKNASQIAMWQNGAWSTLGVGVRAEEFASDPQIYGMAFSGDTLYVGGQFVGAGNKNIDLLAKWENNTWAEVGEGISNDGYDEIRAVAAGPGGAVYVGGTARIIGNQRVDNIARWQNERWYALGGGLLDGEYGDTPATPYAIVVGDDGRVYAGGEFKVAGGVRVSNLAMWMDGVWHNIGDANARVRDMVLAGDDLYVVGEFTQIGGIAANHVARWNQTTEQWSALGAGINDSVYAVAYADGLLYVGGAFKAAGNVTAEDVAYWDGTQWHAFGTKARIFEVGDQGSEVGTYVNDILVNGDSIYIAGHFQVIQIGTNTADLSSFVVTHNVVEWNRSTDDWFYLGDLAQRGVTYNGYSGFSIDANALALVGNTLYVGGQFNQSGGLSASNLASWDIAANQWVSLNASLGGVDESAVEALATYGTDLFVGGKFLSAGNATVNFVAQLDTQTNTWSGLDGGVKWYNDRYTTVTALAVAESGVYLGGDFDKAGGLSATGFAHWGVTLEGGANVTPAQGGTITGPNNVKFDFPAGAVAQESIVSVATLPAPQLPDNQRALYGFRATATTLSGQPITTFAQPYTLRVPYTDAQLTALGITDPTTLNVAFWNGTAWTNMLPCAGCGVDITNKVITVVANHFTDFTVLGQSDVVAPPPPPPGSAMIYLPIVTR